MVSYAVYLDCLKMELLHRLAREYDSGMDEGELHVWASKVVEILNTGPKIHTGGSHSD